jgi:hypothetical protein
MNKKIIFIVIGLVLVAMFMATVLGGGIFYLYYNGYFSGLISQSSFDPADISYVVGGQAFDMKDGKAEIEYAPDSAVKNKLSIFGEPVRGDLDGDGDEDATLWLVNEPGGSGTFYYAVLAINNGTATPPVSTNTLLLGDRIAPQTLEIHDGNAVYNYAERRSDEPMTTAPSVGRSFYINYNKVTGQISEGAGEDISI